MATIFLEPNLLALESAEEASTQLRYLVESGAKVVLVSDHRLQEWDELGVADLRYARSADAGRRGDWWLTADADDCVRRPGHGVRSVLVGGSTDGSVGGSGSPTGPALTARCDVGARDLRSAVLEILSRQAMPEVSALAR